MRQIGVAEPLRAVINTNVWISAFINPLGAPQRLVLAFLAGVLAPVISNPMIDELVRVALRPRVN